MPQIVITQREIRNLLRVLEGLRHGTHFGVECWCPEGMLPESLHHDSCVEASLLFDKIVDWEKLGKE